MQVCPLYGLSGREPLVARGKLNLWSLYQEGRLTSGEVVREVLEGCLTCGACAERCAVGLVVPELIKAARAEIRAREGRHWSPALLLAHLTWQAPHLIPHLTPVVPLLNLLKTWVGSESGLLFRLWPHLVQGVQRLPEVARRPFRSQAPRCLPGRGNLKIGFFAGCGIEALFPAAGLAFLAICERLGIEVAIPPGQGCCGLLAESSGERELALAQARRLVQEFAGLGVDFVVSACASCSYQLKRLGGLLAEAPEARAAATLSGKVKEACEFLVQVAGYHPAWQATSGPVVFHDPCHLHRGQGIVEEPRRLLKEARGEAVIEAPERVCCGLGGAFGVLYPELSQELGQARLKGLQGGGEPVVVTSCSGCLVQLQGVGQPRQVWHLLEVVRY